MAQPQLSMWKNRNAHHDTGPHELHHTHNTPDHIRIGCGYEYYVFYELGDDTNYYSICNEGDATLTFTTPLQFVGTGGANFAVTQPSQSSVAPGMCIDFQVAYTAPSSYESADLTMAFQTNDPNAENCSIQYEVGAFAVIDPCSFAAPQAPQATNQMTDCATVSYTHLTLPTILLV